MAAALNGDVDNHVELRAAEALATPAEITTDAKVIPMLVSRRMAEGADPGEAFRRTVATFEGSVAIAANAAADPGAVLLALRGSGQALYIGLADDAYVVASEPYGVVEETPRYLRMDGEATGGQVVVLRRDGAGTLAGLERRSYDGAALPVADDEITVAEITTRDIDRAGFPHFLLKEVSEAPESFRKTLRGKVTDDGGQLTVSLGEETLPALGPQGPGRRRLPPGAGHRSGDGGGGRPDPGLDAGVGATARPPALAVAALPASELSGFGLDDDMSDTLVIAISQSGTTTDTNRTVDLVRARGAAVLAIVNRRNSDLVEKADGVLYTSDGRDVEMSVASTKAFYAQVAAGFLLSLAIAKEIRAGAQSGAGEAGRLEHDLLAGLRDLPAALEEVLTARPEIAAAAWALRPLPPPLGGGRQRPQPARRLGAADQAVGAGLQVDRLRRHRGQEAHRPVVGAADPGVRRRAGAGRRRRRRQGAGHLPGPQGGAGGHRHPGHRRSRRRWPPSRCRRCIPSWPSCCRPWPATCSATKRRWPSTPRPAACGRSGPRWRTSSATATARPSTC